MSRWVICNWGSPGGASGKESTYQCRRHRRCRFNPWVRKIPWSRAWQPTLVFLPGKFHGQRSLAGYSPWGPKELDMTEWLSTQYVTSDSNSGLGAGSSKSCKECLLWNGAIMMFTFMHVCYTLHTYQQFKASLCINFHIWERRELE